MPQFSHIQLNIELKHYLFVGRVLDSCTFCRNFRMENWKCWTCFVNIVPFSIFCFDCCRKPIQLNWCAFIENDIKYLKWKTSFQWMLKLWWLRKISHTNVERCDVMVSNWMNKQMIFAHSISILVATNCEISSLFLNQKHTRMHSLLPKPLIYLYIFPDLVRFFCFSNTNRWRIVL